MRQTPLKLRTRAAPVTPATLDETARTVEVVWTTGADVDRGDYVETLDVSETAIRLDRLRDAAPVLDGHNQDGVKHVVGVVEDAWLTGGLGLARIRLATGEAGDDILAKIRDGVLTKVSVGYAVHEWVEESHGDALVLRATDWEPTEISIVAVPADPGARIRSRQKRNSPVTKRRTAPRKRTEELEARMSEEDRMAEEEARMAEEEARMSEEERMAEEEARMSEEERTDDELREGEIEDQRMDDDLREGEADELRTGEDDEAREGEHDELREGEDDELREEEELAARGRSRRSARSQAAGIAQACRDFGLASLAPRMIQQHRTAAAARIALQRRLAQTQRRPPRRMTVTRDAAETRLRGMAQALRAMASPGRYAMKGPAEQFRGMTLMDMARSCLQAQGRRTDGMSRVDIARAALAPSSGRRDLGGLQASSDFNWITADVINRVLRDEYARREPTWSQISRARTARDFRELYSIRAGGDFALKSVSEQGEYERGTITDEAEGLTVSKYGRIIGVTLETLINDDLNVFGMVPQQFARAARNRESAIVWGLIRDNAALKSDAKGLFHADHNNLGTAASIDVQSISAARQAFWAQTAFGGDEEDYLDIEPDLLFIPPSLETEARQFVSDLVVPTTDGDINPYKSMLTPIPEVRLSDIAGGSDTAWYLFASDLPPIEHAYLEGYEGIYTEQRDGFEIDGVEIKARLFFGAAVVEYRGAFKNPGA